MKKLLPEMLVARFIKSATNGRIISIKRRRVYTIFIFPIWILGLIFSVICLVNGVIAFTEQSQIKDAIEANIKRLEVWRENNNNDSTKTFLERGRADEDFFWYNFNSKDKDLKNELYSAEYQSNQIYVPIGLLFVLFIFPWCTLRLIYWVKDADKVQEQDNTP